MSRFEIPEKEKCPSNGYTVPYTRDFIDEMCNNPKGYRSDMYIGAINSALVIYKYSPYISKDWIEYVIRRLEPYID